MNRLPILNIFLMFIVVFSLRAANYDPNHECREYEPATSNVQYYAFQCSYSDCLENLDAMYCDPLGTQEFLGNLPASYGGKVSCGSRGVTYGDQKVCPAGFDLDLSDCSCGCPTGMHSYQDICVADDQCPDMVQDHISQCDTLYGASNWDSNYTCSYDATTGISIDNGAVCTPISSSSSLSSLSSSSISSSVSSSTSTPPFSSASSATSGAASSSGSTSGGTTGSSSSSACPPDPCPNLLQNSKNACTDQGGTNDYQCNYDQFTCSYNWSGFCYGSSGQVMSSASSTTANSSTSSIGTSSSSGPDCGDYSVVLEDSPGMCFEYKYKDSQQTILCGISPADCSILHSVTVNDRCKYKDEHSHFSQGYPFTFGQIAEDGNYYGGHCDCDDCYVNFDEGKCSLDYSRPECNDLHVDTPEELTIKQGFHDLNKTLSKLNDDNETVKELSNVNDNITGLRDDLNNSFTDVSEKLTKINKDTNATGQKLHEDLNKTNDLLSDLKSLFDFNSSDLSAFDSSRLDSNISGNQYADFSGQVTSGMDEFVVGDILGLSAFSGQVPQPVCVSVEGVQLCFPPQDFLNQIPYSDIRSILIFIAVLSGFFTVFRTT